MGVVQVEALVAPFLAGACLRGIRDLLRGNLRVDGTVMTSQVTVSTTTAATLQVFIPAGDALLGTFANIRSLLRGGSLIRALPAFWMMSMASREITLTSYLLALALAFTLFLALVTTFGGVASRAEATAIAENKCRICG